jgi:hypothetical protein
MTLSLLTGLENGPDGGRVKNRAGGNPETGKIHPADGFLAVFQPN